jgi:multidrug resistance efflux pump
MKTTLFSRRVMWVLGLALLGIGLPVAGILTSCTSNSLSSGSRGDGNAPGGGQGVVCMGQVDLEHGVTALFPLQPGRVARVLVWEGETVEGGAVLVRLEDVQARARVAEAEAALDAAKLQLDQARKAPDQLRSRIAQQQDATEAMRARLSAARHAHARKQKLAGHIDPSELEISGDRIKEFEALVRVEEKRLADLKKQDPLDDERRARRDVALWTARLDQARCALDDCALKAPCAGTVLRLHVGPGDVLSGQPRQPAVEFAADGPLVVRAEVEQEFAGRIAVGQRVSVQDEANADSVWPGKVKRVANWFAQRRTIMHEPFESTDVRTVECLITLDADHPSLRIGQRVRVFVGSAESP